MAKTRVSIIGVNCVCVRPAFHTKTNQLAKEAVNYRFYNLSGIRTANFQTDSINFIIKHMIFAWFLAYAICYQRWSSSPINNHN